MTDVILFNQYFTSKKTYPEKNFATIPLNLLYIASYLNDKGMDCKIYELGIFDAKDIIIHDGRIRCGIPDDKIREIINNENPKIIGLGGMYSRHYIDVISISRLIKETNPSIKVVLGGNHATDYWDMVLKEKSVDYVVKGEGEITFYELCKSLLTGDPNIETINGLGYKDSGGKISETPERGLIENLDDLPSLDYSLIDIKKYASVSYGSPYLMRYPAIGVVSSRGCPSKCVFCTVKAVWGRTWRGHSAKRTVDELELLSSKYGIKEFAFYDDSASLSRKRWNELCDEIINRKLDVRWTTPNGIAHWTLTIPIIKKMKSAGCYRLTFGIESGSKETRDFIQKGNYKLSQAKELLQYANKIGMWTICTHIIGFPYETKEQIDETINFAKTSGTDFATFYLLAPHVASDVYSYFRNEDLLNFDSVFEENNFDAEKYEEMNNRLNEGGIPTKYFTSEELKEIQRNAYKSFILHRAISFLNPLRIIRKVRSVEDLRYTLRLGRVGFKLLAKSFYKNTTRTLLYDYHMENIKAGNQDSAKNSV